MSRKVLIVDDDPGIRETLTAILEFEGYDTYVASDGVDALPFLDLPDIGLVLLDLMMPRMDGSSFAQEMAQRGLRHSIPVVVLTASGRAEQEAKSIGADDYLAKPFDIADLIQKIQHHLTE